MNELKSAGVPKTIFVVGLIAAILVSSLVAAVTMTQLPTAKGQQPTQASLVIAQWTVIWKGLTGDLNWAGDLGTSKFCSTFDYNWGTGDLFYNGVTYYYDYVGFYAYMRIYKTRDGPVTFTVGADDSYWLYIDGVTWIKDWTTGGYRTTQKTLNYLSQGFHTLELYYKEKTSYARVTFSCDSDLLMWLG